MTTVDSVQLQPVGPDQAELLADVALRAYDDHYLHLWFDAGEWYKERCFTPEVLGREMADPNARFFLVQLDGRPVGFVKLNIDQPLTGQENRNALELERIYLMRVATGQGVGRAIMQQVEQLARARHKDLIWLKAMDSSTDAIRFYQQNGFSLCGTHRLDFPRMKPEYRGMVVMKKAL